MSNYVVKVPPDYLPLTAQDFIRHFANLLTSRKLKLWIEFEKYTKVLGYSCRSLFELIMQHYASDDLVIATTPLHHTSFRNIIERYVKPENIHIIHLNKNINEITKVPNIEKCDLVVITHLFGQDFDLSKLAKFKKKHNCLVIEDRVQGGEMDKKFSHDVADVSIYSMAMDKRPIALGGGFMYIDNKHNQFIQDMIDAVDKLPSEGRKKRFRQLLKKIPTYLFYNSRPFLFTFINILRLLNKFTKKISILTFAKFYRKENPGFEHKNYMMKPSRGLLKSMYENFHKYKEVEEIYTKKYDFFIKSLSPKIVEIFFPWYKGNKSLTPYNTIVVNDQLAETFLEFLDENNMSCLPNPTYKVFNHSYEDETRYMKFNDGIVYLPSIANMSKEEIIFLTNKIKEFYVKYQSKIDSK
jgi:dTDP-4-amino-4,6-dideoxygalactose transaminase